MKRRQKWARGKRQGSGEGGRQTRGWDLRERLRAGQKKMVEERCVCFGLSVSKKKNDLKKKYFFKNESPKHR